MTVLLPSAATARSSGHAQTLIAEQVASSAAWVERVAPEPRGRPVVVATPTPAPAPTPTEEPPPPATSAPLLVAARAPVVVAPRPAPTAAPPAVVAPAACPTNFFCYPRVGIAGAIVPYADCSGVTDVGVAIRELTCVRGGIWLAGHAYTQFGEIANFSVGDIVFVRGERFAITGSSVQRACAPATGAIAPLSLQTSLDSTACGRVLVVQAART